MFFFELRCEALINVTDDTFEEYTFGSGILGRYALIRFEHNGVGVDNIGGLELRLGGIVPPPTPAVVPEPGSMLLLASALALGGAVTWFRRGRA